MTDGSLLPTTGKFHVKFQGNQLKSEIAASRNFRLPGFNDLYWQNAGNEDLLPEKGIECHAHIKYTSPVMYQTILETHVKAF